MTRRMRRLGRVVGLLAAIAAVVAGGLWLRGEVGWRPLPAEAPLTSTALDPAFEDAAREAIADLETMRAEEGVPGVTAAVAVDGALVWMGAAGWSDLEAGTPMTPDAVMRIGSTSKAMTATMLARLHDRGVLSMSDTVGEHVAEPLNPAWANRRLRQLMSHTAGLPGYRQNTDWFGVIGTIRMQKSYESVEDGLRLVDGSRLLFEPGADYHYSSFDVNLAALVAEHASGRDYEGLIEDEIRTPLGLDTPRLGDRGTPPDEEAHYYRIRGGDRIKSWGHADVSQRWPGGGLIARSRDLVLVASAWLYPEFITPETQAMFWTPVQLESGTVNEENYALGWRVDRVSTRFGEDRAPVRIVHHGGVSRGAMSWLALYPDLGIAVAVNINTNTPEFADFARVEADILRTFADATGRVPSLVEAGAR
ncbi:MAG TPA: serine hydrolase domain-containing protein [Longimicrobiales bacterium]|nr:serine hydrolase domain-containing protein [Longimicrobiales bacterium]